MSFHDLFQWFAGGQRPYMTLRECMMGDTFWITLTVSLDIAVAIGYAMIAKHWWSNARTLANTPARDALNKMRNIFVFCGVCGYAFIPIKMFWPAWRLYDMFMFVLVYFTWSYAWSARDLKVIYSELGRSTKLAADLERSQEESRQKSIFLNSISHDLRTPLNGMMLQSNLARMAAERNDRPLLNNSLDEIEGSIKATSELLDRLLEYARLNAGEQKNSFSTFRLQALVEQIFRTYHATASAKNIHLVCSIAEEVQLHTDPVKLERILNNLVHNAIKFTPEPGGSVTVGAELASNSAEIFVADEGVGIAPEDQKHLFLEFFQAHNAARDRTKGFGLGLAICRRLVLQLGGDLTVKSSLARGSRFSILLPGATTLPEASSQKALAQTQVAGV